MWKMVVLLLSEFGHQDPLSTLLETLRGSALQVQMEVSVHHIGMGSLLQAQYCTQHLVLFSQACEAAVVIHPLYRRRK